MNSKIEDFQHLTVLEALERDKNLSQRGIARATGMNLATVNYCLKRLVDKGFVKLKNVSRSKTKLRYLYIITPEGIWEKSRLTYNFIKKTYRQFRDLEERVEEDLREISGVGSGRIAICGSGEVAEMLVRIMKHLEGLEVVGVVDVNGGGRLGEYLIQPVETLPDLDFDLVILSDPRRREVLAEIVGAEKVWIIGHQLNGRNEEGT